MTALSPDPLVAKHARKGLLVDTNLLILFALGTFSRALVGKNKRIDKYSTEDFDWIHHFIGLFGRIIVTPHILAEVSNLALPSKRDQPRKHVATVLDILRATRELYIEKDCLLVEEHVAWLGITDSAIIELARREGYLVLTDDFPLAGYLQSYGCDVVNLNHVRSVLWSHQ